MIEAAAGTLCEALCGEAFAREAPSRPDLELDFNVVHNRQERKAPQCHRKTGSVSSRLQTIVSSPILEKTPALFAQRLLLMQ